MGKIIARFNPAPLKTASQMTMAYQHNMRIGHCENIDASKSGENVILIDNGNYKDFYDRRIAESWVPNKHPKNGADMPIRADADRMLDFRISVNANEAAENPLFDLEEFLRISKEFAIAKFGEQNIAGMVYHADESGPHIHCMIVPLTEDGHLNAHAYNTPKQCREIQDEIAKATSHLGLKRGTPGHIAKRDTIKEFYGDVQSARTSSLPEPVPGESNERYKERCDKELLRIQTHHLLEKKELEQRIRDILTVDRQEKINYTAQLEQTIHEQESEISRLESTCNDLKKQLEISQKSKAVFDDVVYAIRHNLLSEEDRNALNELMTEAMNAAKNDREITAKSDENPEK